MTAGPSVNVHHTGALLINSVDVRAKGSDLETTIHLAKQLGHDTGRVSTVRLFIAIIKIC